MSPVIAAHSATLNTIPLILAAFIALGLVYWALSVMFDDR